MSDKVIVLKAEEEWSKALKDAGDKLVAVDFTASWCGPCKFIGPIFAKMSTDEANANVVFLKVDVDLLPETAAAAGVNCMPTFHFYKNGEKVDEFSGASEQRLEEFLAKHR
eukprot:TRINITY_DN28177_c0_g1_i1.p2 TRINITY_DN28177_c0_g1~~TRINITY_DN28177_c0_g1_i1.p2  ORF type:complete len:111 (+),score=46.42 TRINITY_DN28177_c0_g1_i1:26-358(+)